MNDLNMVHVPRVTAHQMQELLKAEVACVVYVYSPTCGACHATYRDFDAAVGHMETHEKNRFFRYNAVPTMAQAQEASEKFLKVTGANIMHYPTVYGFSPGAIKGRRVFEYNGNYETSNLLAFLRSLQNGQVMSVMSRNK
jgi:hypothetical protein